MSPATFSKVYTTLVLIISVSLLWLFMGRNLFLAQASTHEPTITPTETIATPSSTPSPTSSPENTPTPTTTSPSPTPSPKTTTSPTPKAKSLSPRPTEPRPTLTPTSSPTPLNTPTITPTPQDGSTLGIVRNLLAAILIIAGASLLGTSFYLHKKKLGRKLFK